MVPTQGPDGKIVYPVNINLKINFINQHRLNYTLPLSTRSETSSFEIGKSFKPTHLPPPPPRHPLLRDTLESDKNQLCSCLSFSLKFPALVSDKLPYQLLLYAYLGRFSNCVVCVFFFGYVLLLFPAADLSLIENKSIFFLIYRRSMHGFCPVCNSNGVILV